MYVFYNDTDMITTINEILLVIKNEGIISEEDMRIKMNVTTPALRRGISFLYEFGFVEYAYDSTKLNLCKPVKDLLPSSCPSVFLTR